MNARYFNFNNSPFQFSFCIFSLLLISGPFLPDLMVTLMSLYFIAYCIYNKKIFFYKKKLIIFFLIFYLYININSYFSDFSSVSFATSVPYIRMILFAVFTAYLLKKISNLKKIIFFSFLSSYLILLLDSLIQIKTGQNISGYPIINSRVSSFFGDKLIMGSYAIRTLPILIAISYFEDFKHNNFLRALCIVLVGILVFFSSERVSSIFYITTVVTYLFFLPNKKQFFFHIGLLGFVFSILFFFKPSSIDRIYGHTLSQFKQSKVFLFSERHQMHFLTAYRMFSDKIFFGHGIKSFRYLCDDPRYTVRDVIENNNKKFSPVDGYFYLFAPDHSLVTSAYLIKNSEKDEFEKIMNSSKQVFESFLDKYSVVNFYVSGHIFDQIESGTSVNKGDFIVSNSEYRNGCNTHPHNSHLQILSELGLLGYLFFVSFFIYLIVIFVQNAINNFLSKNIIIQENNKRLYGIFIVLGIIQSLFPIIPSGNIFNNWISCMLYFKLAFLFHYLYFQKKC